ncbi:hypothetical protein SERLA73DRAFT_174766 [Serpula lacrymans var. lacrymans S7.3]|uniref:GPI inositol-deacylase n=1 Tax=Serpula lacrymans var. lacrymans (strain S7.3) TaxID=936435 RepID=F8PKI9_SERL3|nr:hypothetical protein SERLA73DRAFT_174766 [Serpula lacrymans var. lacrymans S7.3]
MSSHSPALKYPVVLIHGFCDRPKYTGVWKAAKRTLRRRGIDVLVPTLSATASISQRTEELVRKIKAKYPQGTRLHLIGHSMGGLNARDIASTTKEHGLRILSVTTIGTPHRGYRPLDKIISGRTGRVFKKLTPCMPLLFPYIRQNGEV